MELYQLRMAEGTVQPIIANIPHSGTYIPDSIRQQFKADCPPLANMDWHLDKLYAFLPELGITTLQATHSRYVVDLNRRLREPLSGSYRNAIIYTENTFGTPLYDTLPSAEEIQARLDQYYHPYHRTLTALLEEMRARSEKLILLDLHSFFAQHTRDVCLGNQHHRTSSLGLIEPFRYALVSNGFSVAVNEVLLGGYITQHYGQWDNVESLQVEIRYPVYLDRDEWGEEEAIVWQSERFYDAQARLRRAFARFIEAQQSLKPS